MNKKAYILIIFFLFSGLFIFAADLPESVTFPIPELGGCENKEDCKLYCDQSDNALPCLDFAEVHNILPQEEINNARHMLSIIRADGGPGGCRNETGCNSYCNDPVNIEECILFAKVNDLIPSEELAETEMVLAAIRAGTIPPNCNGKAACDEYCAQSENLTECLDFGIAAGFVSSEEAELIKRMGGNGPGDCRDQEECDVYCNDLNNMEECISFSLQYGLMPANELEDAQMMLGAIKKGAILPNCRGEEECEIYCSQPEHMLECVNFAEIAGYISSGDAERARKMVGLGLDGGPGDCKGEEECRVFCDDPYNLEECIGFSVMVGDMTREEAERILRGGPGGCRDQIECEAYCSNPSNAEECIMSQVKSGEISAGEAQQRIEQMYHGPSQEQMQQEQMMFSPEEYEQLQQEMMEEQVEQMQQEVIEQQIKEMEQQMGPPSGEPQSFFDQIGNFIAGVANFLNISPLLEL